jgi:hypothetical protein
LRNRNPPDEVTRTATSSKSVVRRTGNGLRLARSVSMRLALRALSRPTISSMKPR